MGLKDDLIQAKVDGMVAGGVKPADIDTSKGSTVEVEAEATKEAILNFLERANLRVTDLKAPVVLESFTHPAQLLNVAVDAVMGPHGVLMKALKQVASLVPGASMIFDKTEEQMKKATAPVAEGGVTQSPPGLDVNSGLDAHGYMFVGDDDPGSKDDFNVSDEDGQKIYTQVKFFRDENEGIS